MIKCKYVKPTIEIIHVEAETFICTSNESIKGNAGNEERFPDGSLPEEGGGAGWGSVADEQDF